MKLFDGLARYQPQALGVLRIMTALQFIEHGTQKLFNFPASDHVASALSGLPLAAGILEFVGGILLALGLFTRPVAFLLAGEMAIAYFMAHMPRDFFPVNNSGDSAISFCFIFLYLVFAGAGAFALDNRRSA
ncbi:DoxX family protein [Mesorhizobium sp. CO1-1-7]|uniref:DoxX family protein n=1 Tax=unclassified Mesorhizobium TaxID=325217 RepID=UPI0011287AC5|nr:MULTISPECIES: DoxX family protein [unclassified Mesorhizobium]MBZ9746358.1 DoxX family protein [Mesorhizobium sp. CO1-1-7]TPJ15780.1 DoxX family protein [Mesorhizobium sp. B2-7-3]TPL87458.1 DoxX family protein [Mesorhizobium sp. B2-3-14]